MSTVVYTISLSGIAAAIASIIAFIALLYTVKEFRSNRKTEELQIFDKTYYNIITTERFLREKYSQNPTRKVEWDNELYNQIEYFSFLVNNKFIEDSRLYNYLGGAVIGWYEDIFKKFASPQDQLDPKTYAEWKRLYSFLKERTSENN